MTFASVCSHLVSLQALCMCGRDDKKWDVAWKFFFSNFIDFGV